MAAANDAKQIYIRVVHDVCTAVREALIEEGYDEHTLQELKNLWLAKVSSSKALEPVTASAVDEATTRNNRRLPPATTANNDTNHSILLNNKPTTATTMRQIPLHQASMSAMTTFNGAYSSAAMPNNGNMANNNNSNITYLTQSQALSRLQNPSSMGNNGMKTAGQSDGAHDEEMPPTKTKKKSSGRRKKSRTIQVSFQVDGTGPPLTDDEDDDEDNEPEKNDVAEELDEEDDDDEEGHEDGNEDPDPLCSDDDVSDDEPAELFETDNVVVCQYDKISRTKNKWRFILKSGVMNINGHDYVFSKANGDADW